MENQTKNNIQGLIPASVTEHAQKHGQVAEPKKRRVNTGGKL